MLGNMAGNAYSMFHYLPWSIATMCTYARFRGSSAPEIPVAKPDEEQVVNSSESSERSDSD